MVPSIKQGARTPYCGEDVALLDSASQEPQAAPIGYALTDAVSAATNGESPSVRRLGAAASLSRRTRYSSSSHQPLGGTPACYKYIREFPRCGTKPPRTANEH